jgi:prepilin peptidase CpaA
MSDADRSPTPGDKVSFVLEYTLLLVFPAAMAFAGAMDLLTMTIPNRISVALCLAFVAAALLAGLSTEAWASHVSAAALVLAAGIGMFTLGWLGGGDAKLMTAAALWIGLDNLLVYLTMMAILGGALALLILAYRRLPATALPGPSWAAKLHKSGTGMPYGLAIAGAALWIYPKTPWFSALGS